MGSISYGVRDIAGLGVFGHGYVSFNFGGRSYEYHAGPSEADGTPDNMGPEDFFAAIYEQRSLVVREYDPRFGLYGGPQNYSATLAALPDSVVESIYKDGRFRKPLALRAAA